MMCLLDPSKVDDALALVTDLSDKLEDRTLEVRFPKSSRSVPLLYASRLYLAEQCVSDELFVFQDKYGH